MIAEFFDIEDGNTLKIGVTVRPCSPSERTLIKAFARQGGTGFVRYDDIGGELVITNSAPSEATP